MLYLSINYYAMRQTYTLLILAFLMGATAMAQDKSPDTLPVLQHEMSPAELLHKSEIGRNFVETGPPVAPVRNVAEFERMQGALVRYPFGIPVSLIKEMATNVTVTTTTVKTIYTNAVLSTVTTNSSSNSPKETISKPEPKRAKILSKAIFEFAFTA